MLPSGADPAFSFFYSAGLEERDAHRRPTKQLRGRPMRNEALLNTIRTKLFYGLSDYTKSFPDFSIPQRFRLASPKEGNALLQDIRSSLRDEKEILLYVHLPFCFSECLFCNAFPRKSSQSIQKQYLESLMKEVEMYSASGIFDGKKAKCVYFGGGTPTIFSNEDIRKILDKIRLHLDLSENCNITSEAHPKGLVKNDRMAELSDLGIDRISIGCQTFDPKVLELCNRSNSATLVEEVIRAARKLGLSTNIDMMIGLPGQTLEGVGKDLDTLSVMAPDSIEYMRHEIVNPLAISLYQSNPGLLVKTDDLFWMAYHTQEWMETKGYEQNGRFTSEKYFPYRYHWLQEVPFVSLGSRSRSYTKTVCYDKHEDITLYMALIDKGVFPIARYMVLTKKEQMYRSLFLSLQIRNGLDLDVFSNSFGDSALEVFAHLLERLAGYGCITVDRSAIKLSKHGRYFVEDVCCFIIDDALREGDYHGQLKREPHSSGALSARAIDLKPTPRSI